MALNDPYTTVEVLRTRVNVPDSNNDAQLERVIASASREVDGLCNRFFYKTDLVARTFSPVTSDLLVTGDLISVTSIASDPNGQRLYPDTWATSDYELGPYDAAYQDRPFTELYPVGNYSLRCDRASILITGVWGWPAIPAAIEEATLLIAVRLWQRKLAPFGVAGITQDGQLQYVPKNDPDVRTLLEPYRWYAVGPV